MGGIGSRSNPGSSADFNPTTRDFRGTSDGYWTSTHWVDQAVTLALTIERGKLRSVPDQGVRYRQIKRLGTPSVQAEVEDMTREALSRLLSSPPKIEIVSIETQQPVRGQLLVAVTYRNLVTGQRKTARNYDQKAAARASSLTFDPNTAGTLKFWVRADNVSPTVWPDKSSSGFHLNIVSGSAPTQVTNVVNGMPVVRFVRASSQDYRRAQGSVIGTGGFTYFVVCRQASVGTAQTNFAVDTGSGPTGGVTNSFTGTQYDVRFLGVSDHNGGTPTTAGFEVQEARRVAGAAPTFLRNGTTVSIGANTSNPVVGGTTRMAVGSAATFSEFYDGDIAEVLLYVPELSVANASLVRAYLGAEYAIAVI